MLFRSAAGSTNPVGSNTGSGSGAALNFNTDIKPILSAKCGGNSCHDDGGTLGVSSQWINDETKFKASDSKNRVDSANAPMPPATSPALTSAEKDKILQFLTP